jgi:hypothetical protein
VISGSLSEVVVEHATQSLSPAHRPTINGVTIGNDQPMIEALVVAFTMAMAQKFTNLLGNEASPNKIMRSRQDSLIVRTNRSAWAFRFGECGGSLTDSMPLVASFWTNSAVNKGSRIVDQVPHWVDRVGQIPADLAHPQPIRNFP